MDELILITSSIFFFIQLIKKKFIYDNKNTFFIIILVILFLQSVVGLYFDYRSIRYFIIYPCLIIAFLYFASLREVNESNQVIFFNYIFYGILIYVIYQLFFWFLKFYIFDMKFFGQRFIGDMQPGYSLSSSGHFDSIHIITGYLILYFITKSESLIKGTILLLSILAFWIFADARSSLFILILVIIFSFFLFEKKFKFIFIFFIFLISFQQTFFENSFNKYLKRAQNISKDVLTFKKDTVVRNPIYLLENDDYFYKEKIVPAYRDFGRLSFILGGLNSLKYNGHFIIFGCGFYSYYQCAQEGRIEIYEKYNIPINQNNSRGFGGNKIRPPAAGTILVENGLIIILLGFFYYLIFLKKNIRFFNGKIQFDSNKILLTFYLISAISVWTIFSNILDIIYIYLFLMPIFRKYLIKLNSRQ